MSSGKMARAPGVSPAKTLQQSVRKILEIVKTLACM